MLHKRSSVIHKLVAQFKVVSIKYSKTVPNFGYKNDNLNLHVVTIT
jgi:hypothetical protein